MAICLKGEKAREEDGGGQKRVTLKEEEVFSAHPETSKKKNPKRPKNRQTKPFAPPKELIKKQTTTVTPLSQKQKGIGEEGCKQMGA